MGRVKSDSYITHRIEFGVKEREYLDTLQAVTIVSAGSLAISAVGIAAGIALAGYAAYWASKKAWAWGDEAADEIQQWYENVSGGVGVKEAVVGRAKYTDPNTGVVHTNPFAGVPILGSLFGSGINIGIASYDKWGPD